MAKRYDSNGFEAEYGIYVRWVDYDADIAPRRNEAMITSENGIVPCNCRSAGECHHNTFAEVRALDQLVHEFAEEMKLKLHKKWAQGQRGWDDPACADGIREGMLAHAKRPGQEIDMANMAAMLWNFQRAKTPRAEHEPQ